MSGSTMDLTVEERLRLNAESICKQVGDEWRDDVAKAMGCPVRDVGAGPVGRHRDSEALDESNFRVVLRDLQAVDERVSVERFRHWGFGWMEEIVVPLDNPAMVGRVEGWVTALEDDPVADELDYVELEAEEAADRTALDADEDDDLNDVTEAGPPNLRTGLREGQIDCSADSTSSTHRASRNLRRSEERGAAGAMAGARRDDDALRIEAVAPYRRILRSVIKRLKYPGEIGWAAVWPASRSTNQPVGGQRELPARGHRRARWRPAWVSAYGQLATLRVEEPGVPTH